MKVTINTNSKRLIGFNNRRYDNHILYARMLGYSELQLYKLSRRLIEGSPNSQSRKHDSSSKGGSYGSGWKDNGDI